MIIRPFRAEDFDAVYRINAASTPGVSEETPDDLRTIVGLGTCLIAEGDDGQVFGAPTGRGHRRPAADAGSARGPSPGNAAAVGIGLPGAADGHARTVVGHPRAGA